MANTGCKMTNEESFGLISNIKKSDEDVDASIQDGLGKSQAFVSARKVAFTFGLCSAAVAFGVLFTRETITPVRAALWKSDDDADGWYAYKTAYPARNGTIKNTLSFMAGLR